MLSAFAQQQSRWRSPATLLLFLGLISLTGWIMFAGVPVEAPAVEEEGKSIATSSTSVLTLPASDPVRLSIPAVGIDAVFEDTLYLAPNNEIAVPEGYETVGYYGYGPTPGELGPAVVLGHVDSYRGPAVFYRLDELTVGDTLSITRADGSIAEFTVTRLEEHSQAGFPTEQVYSDIDHAGLRLITCSGTYDRSVERYTHNFIVFAELTSVDTVE